MAAGKMHYVYHICDPISGEVRYVGKSADPEKRLYQHYMSCQNQPLTDWLNSLRNAGTPAVLRIVFESELWNVAEDHERGWISRLARIPGHLLFNRDFRLSFEERDTLCRLEIANADMREQIRKNNRKIKRLVRQQSFELSLELHNAKKTDCDKSGVGVGEKAMVEDNEKESNRCCEPCG